MKTKRIYLRDTFYCSAHVSLNQIKLVLFTTDQFAPLPCSPSSFAGSSSTSSRFCAWKDKDESIEGQQKGNIRIEVQTNLVNI